MGDDITIGVTEIVNNIEVTAQPNDQIVDISVTDNADNVTLNITPTVVEVNINKGSSFAQWGDLYGTLSDQTDLQNALNLKANLVGGKVPASELPSYVDDIIEVANYAALPATGEIGKIYVTLDNNKIYRWSGSIYIEIASNSAIWGAITGTLTDQTDLVTALNAKQNTITLTTTGTTGAATLVGSTLNIPNYTTDISGLVPYTGATTNVDLGTHKLTASDLVINHASGSGVAASITKGGNGEALTVVKSSGSGNAASITGGTTLISELHLTTDLADDYIASAATWNAKQAALNGTGFVKISGTTISYDNTTYLSGTVAIANGGTGATTAGAALTNLGGTTVGTNIFTSANPSPYTSAYLKVKPDNSVEWLEANAFRIAIGAGTGNGTVTSVEAVGSYGGLTLTGTVTGSGQITLGGTPTGTWPISISGNASSVNTVQVSTNADFYLTFADANNGSPTSEFLYTIGTVKVNPSTGALTAGSFVKSGGTSSQFLKADGSIDSTTYQTALTNPVTGTGTTNYIPKFTGASAIGNSLIYDNGTNVGIGTTSPASKLDVNGQVRVTDLTLQGFYQSRTSDTVSQGVFGGNSFVLRNGATSEDLNFDVFNRTSSAWYTPMIIKNTGNVGIGTISPGAKLHISGNANSAFLYSDGAGSGYSFADIRNTGARLAFGVENSTGSTSFTGALAYSSWIGSLQSSTAFQIVAGNSLSTTFLANGNVGIGTTSPAAKLSISYSSATADALNIVNTNTNGRSWYVGDGAGLGAGNFGFYDATAGASRLVISSSGNVGIGTTSPTDGKLQVAGNTQLGNTIAQTYFGVGAAATKVTSNGSWAIGVDAADGSTERMRITSGGNVLIGTTTDAGAKLQVSGGNGNGIRVEPNSGAVTLPSTGLSFSTGYGVGYIRNANSSGTQVDLYVDSSNVIFSNTVTATAGFFNSDIRLKDLIDYDYNVSDIKPITYLWKDGRDNKKHVGYSAQEVQKVMPDAVNEGTDGMLSVNYVEVLVAKIAELENRIKQLEK